MFKDKPFDDRLNEFNRIKLKYPYRFPVIVEKHKGSSINTIDKNKYLVTNDMKFCEFIAIIRKRLKLKPENAIFLTVNGVLLSSTELMGKIYQDMKNDDGFLYIEYSMENTFG